MFDCLVPGLEPELCEDCAPEPDAPPAVAARLLFAFVLLCWLSRVPGREPVLCELSFAVPRVPGRLPVLPPPLLVSPSPRVPGREFDGDDPLVVVYTVFGVCKSFLHAWCP